MIPCGLEESSDLSWLPEPSCRPEGFECLIFVRGKWINVCWSKEQGAWALGYGRGFVFDQSEDLYAPLPDNTPPAHFGKPKGSYGFYGWKP